MPIYRVALSKYWPVLAASIAPQLLGIGGHLLTPAHHGRLRSGGLSAATVLQVGVPGTDTDAGWGFTARFPGGMFMTW